VLVGILTLLIGGGAAAFFLLRGDGGDGSASRTTGPTTVVTKTPSEGTPEFEFRLGRTQAIRTASGDREAGREAAEVAAGEIALTMSRMYSLAYLDPTNWRAGTYEPVLAFFDADARQSASEDGGGLTLGSDAGQRFAEVLPASGNLQVQVLLDTAGEPFTAVAHAKFAADADGSDGGRTVVTSRGRYFLSIGDEGTWTIYAYKVKRSEREPADGGTPSPDETVEGGETPSPEEEP
jgi:hypothetical protein